MKIPAVWQKMYKLQKERVKKAGTCSLGSSGVGESLYIRHASSVAHYKGQGVLCSSTQLSKRYLKNIN